MGKYVLSIHQASYPSYVLSIHLAENVLKVDYRDDVSQLLVQLCKWKWGETKSAEELVSVDME